MLTLFMEKIDKNRASNVSKLISFECTLEWKSISTNELIDKSYTEIKIDDDGC